MFKDLFCYPRVRENSRRDLFATFPAHIAEDMGSIISWNKGQFFCERKGPGDFSRESIVARMDALSQKHGEIGGCS